MEWFRCIDDRADVRPAHFSAWRCFARCFLLQPQCWTRRVSSLRLCLECARCFAPTRAECRKPSASPAPLRHGAALALARVNAKRAKLVRRLSLPEHRHSRSRLKAQPLGCTLPKRDKQSSQLSFSTQPFRCWFSLALIRAITYLAHLNRVWAARRAAR